METDGPRPRGHARAIAEAAIAAADPSAAVGAALRRSGDDLVVETGGERVRLGGRVLLVAAGKAARRMAEAALGAMSPAVPEECLVVTTHEAADPLPGCTVLGAGHPSPDPAGQRATAAVMDLAAGAGPDHTLLVLLSGGSSALLPSPVEGVSLADLATTTDLLMSAGADIHQLNCVRKHLSVLQGGGLARLASPATVCCLILSDVVGDDPSVVGSGPTVGDPTTHDDAVDVLHRRGVWNGVPASVRRHLEAGVRGERPDTPGPGDPVFRRTHTSVVSGNGSALRAAAAAARRLGYVPAVVDAALTGEARAAALRLVGDLRVAARSPVPSCLLYGGETTVTVKGDGLGGRCQELALAAALAATELDAAWVLACVGTDGRDGPTDAAGGIVDGGTVARIVAAGGDPDALLAANDSNRALALAGDLVVTGPTGTNVADVVIGLVGAG